jgi:hypothetical protein
MQPALFASNSLSLQAIYDTFYAENTLTNFDYFAELHNEFQLVQSSLIIAATIQKQRSSIPLKASFYPGLDLTFIPERCIPKGATPVASSTTTGTTLAGTFTTSCFVTLEKKLLPEFHCSCCTFAISLNQTVHTMLLLDTIFSSFRCAWDLISMK